MNIQSGRTSKYDINDKLYASRHQAYMALWSHLDSVETKRRMLVRSCPSWLNDYRAVGMSGNGIK